jgi:hypothetical protein
VNKHFKSARNGQFGRSFTGLHNKRAMSALLALAVVDQTNARNLSSLQSTVAIRPVNASYLFVRHLRIVRRGNLPLATPL